MKVIFTEAAELDLEDIGDFVARDSARRAITFVQELRTAARTIGEYPEAFPLIPRYEHRAIRSRPYRAYLIFYRIYGDHISIVHILNSAEDYENILFHDSSDG